MISSIFLNFLIIKSNCSVPFTLLTHGHFDHIGAATELAEKFHVNSYLGEGDFALAKDPKLNCSNLFGCLCNYSFHQVD